MSPLAQSVGRHGITVNCLCPGYTVTGGLDWGVVGARMGVPADEARRRVESETALGRTVPAEELAGALLLLASDDGPSRGVRLLEFRTGTGFGFEVAVDRGFDVGRCDYRGASLAWVPPTQLPGPWFFEDQAGFGWLRAGLGGLNNTCGLVHIGNPEEADVSHYNFPARARERYGVVLKFVPVLDDGRLDMEAYAGLLSEKTKMVAVTHMSNVLGTINDVSEIVRLAQGLGQAAPVNAKLVELVHAAEQGGRREWSGVELLAALTAR